MQKVLILVYFCVFYCYLRCFLRFFLREVLCFIGGEIIVSPRP